MLQPGKAPGKLPGRSLCFEMDPRYIVDLVKRIVRVSVETVRIVKDLPAL